MDREKNVEVLDAVMEDIHDALDVFWLARKEELNVIDRYSVETSIDCLEEALGYMYDAVGMWDV